MKVYSVLATYHYVDKGIVSDSTVFPKVFLSVEAAKEAILEDANEVWDECTGGSNNDGDFGGDFPGLDSTDVMNHSVEFDEESSYTWEIIEQDF